MKKERKRMNIECRKKVRRKCGTSPAAGVYLPEGRLPSTFGVPCSLFDIHLFPFLRNSLFDIRYSIFFFSLFFFILLKKYSAGKWQDFTA
jgi:hypothetical protein